MDTLEVELYNGEVVQVDFVVQIDGSIYYPNEDMYFSSIDSLEDYIENC